MSLLATGACAPARPALDVALPVDPGFGGGGGAATPARWWVALADPTLDRLITQALAGSFDLRVAWTRLRQAEASARAAGAAGRPSLDASVGGSLDAAGSGRSADGDAGLSLGLAASYEIDLWGGIDASREAAARSARASAFDVQAAAITVAGEVALAWYDLAAAEESAALLARQVEASQATLDLVARRVEAGLAPETDRTSQQQAVEALRGQQATAATQIATLQHRLNALLGRSPRSALPPRTGLVALPAQPATGIPSEVLRRRPDVQAAWARIEAADRSVATAVAERYPRLSLSARLSSAAPFEGWLASLAASLVAPLIDGGRRAAEVERARAQLAERVLAYQQAVLTAAVDVEDALAKEAGQVALVASLDRQLELSASTLDSARARYQHGLGDYLRVLDAERSHQALERSRVSARQGLLEARIGLYRALAGGFDLPKPAASS
ncbi:MAG TPA: TolC family protein [Kofleriaceae bacterium]|jgi:NodT family efflux transporter outer membrane factor (OMF) lipoprotein|nr:TolC family protein [Kofleriaceae bacterium]